MENSEFYCCLYMENSTFYCCLNIQKLNILLQVKTSDQCILVVQSTIVVTQWPQTNG
jgi:hypothetical protein